MSIDLARVWVTKRKGARGVYFTLRWIDPTTGNYKGKTAGRDRKAAVKAAALIEDQLRRAVRGLEGIQAQGDDRLFPHHLHRGEALPQRRDEALVGEGRSR